MRTVEAATKAGVNRETLRYYERRGLLPEPMRTGSGYRSYDAGAVRIVRFVKAAQELGFSLTQIESLLHLADGGPASCEVTQALATEKITELDEKIASLQAMRGSLETLLATCQQPHRQRECPLLDSLQPHSAS
jgi:Hg(II)-responsive transcriptional regulator